MPREGAGRGKIRDTPAACTDSGSMNAESHDVNPLHGWKQRFTPVPHPSHTPAAPPMPLSASGAWTGARRPWSGVRERIVGKTGWARIRL
ncbi:hypothetical protein SVIO_092470 [Streptomyces violaceusniger]|uniref:Uncharacterized protein n=1 Tax=Streptomyces violaceusniger TaxID=68280 RepID=A0A4D4LE62_STRVO|nr:hypothetical protein SVIO_092470 [Streptomyces violaceusniger]